MFLRHHVTTEVKGPYSLFMQAHDGEAVEAEIPFPGLLHTAHIRVAENNIKTYS